MLDKEKACTACSGSGYYCSGKCGACNGTGLEYSKDDIIEALELELGQLQNTSPNNKYTATSSTTPKSCTGCKWYKCCFEHGESCKNYSQFEPIQA